MLKNNLLPKVLKGASDAGLRDSVEDVEMIVAAYLITKSLLLNAH